MCVFTVGTESKSSKTDIIVVKSVWFKPLELVQRPVFWIKIKPRSHIEVWCHSHLCSLTFTQTSTNVDSTTGWNGRCPSRFFFFFLSSSVWCHLNIPFKSIHFTALRLQFHYREKRLLLNPDQWNSRGWTWTNWAHCPPPPPSPIMLKDITETSTQCIPKTLKPKVNFHEYTPHLNAF